MAKEKIPAVTNIFPDLYNFLRSHTTLSFLIPLPPFFPFLMLFFKIPLHFLGILRTCKSY
ncbi:hypothetical protein PB1A_1515 [Leuconostoc inhae]|nr:hypothetical protein PB1A_1515 [Leuconostoc inhae]